MYTTKRLSADRHIRNGGIKEVFSITFRQSVLCIHYCGPPAYTVRFIKDGRLAPLDLFYLKLSSFCAKVMAKRHPA